MSNIEEMLTTLKKKGIYDKEILLAMSKVPRKIFVAKEESKFAYEDRALPIGYRQTISEPYIVAFITEISKVTANSKVLEIGTGCGYQSAVLAEIAKQVYSLGIIKELADKTTVRLKNLGYSNIYIRNSNGYEGWPEQAPFDVIIVTAAPKQIPLKLVQQLKIGGRLIIPVGDSYQNLKRITRNKSGVTEENFMAVNFVPMVHAI